MFSVKTLAVGKLTLSEEVLDGPGYLLLLIRGDRGEHGQCEVFHGVLFAKGEISPGVSQVLVGLLCVEGFGVVETSADIPGGQIASQFVADRSVNGVEVEDMPGIPGGYRQLKGKVLKQFGIPAAAFMRWSFQRCMYFVFTPSTAPWKALIR